MNLIGDYGSIISAYPCDKHDNQRWIWNTTDGTVRKKFSNECLTVSLELEVWASPLSDGSQTVILLNRADNGIEEIIIQWTDIGFSTDHSAVVRDLWVPKDLGVFTSPKIDSHAVMMLNITLTK